jgi:4-cresol dehydrogenase (hydroxylating) flavoprotein subunit
MTTGSSGTSRSHGITPKLLEPVVSISFDRSRPADIEAARACDEALHDAFAAGGYVPYRLGLQHQVRARTAGEQWATIEAIKHGLDPAAIIALGKYGA